MLTKQENIGGGEVIHNAVMMGRVSHVIVDVVGDDKVFCEEIRKEKIRNNKGKNVHTVHIHVRVHKWSCRPCMPEYGSGLRTLHIYACVCICKACERCLSME